MPLVVGEYSQDKMRGAHTPATAYTTPATTVVKRDEAMTAVVVGPHGVPYDRHGDRHGDHGNHRGGPRPQSHLAYDYSCSRATGQERQSILPCPRRFAREVESFMPPRFIYVVGQCIP